MTTQTTARKTGADGEHSPASKVRWRKMDPYHAVSDCGCYTVARTGRGEGTLYTAWLVDRRGHSRETLYIGSDPRAAARVCEEHKAASSTGDGERS